MLHHRPSVVGDFFATPSCGDGGNLLALLVPHAVLNTDVSVYIASAPWSNPLRDVDLGPWLTAKSPDPACPLHVATVADVRAAWVHRRWIVLTSDAHCAAFCSALRLRQQLRHRDVPVRRNSHLPAVDLCGEESVSWALPRGRLLRRALHITGLFPRHFVLSGPRISQAAIAALKDSDALIRGGLVAALDVDVFTAMPALPASALPPDGFTTDARPAIAWSALALPALTSLSVRLDLPSPDDVAAVLRLPSVRSVRVPPSSAIAALRAVVAGAVGRSLRSLWLSAGHMPSGSTPKVPRLIAPNLVSLGISGPLLFAGTPTSDGTPELCTAQYDLRCALRECVSLTSLCVHSCTADVPTNSQVALLGELPALTDLTLSQCQAVTASGLSRMALMAPLGEAFVPSRLTSSLTSLTATCWALESVHSVAAIARFQGLQHVYLEPRTATEKGAICRALQHALPFLETLHVRTLE